LYRQRILFKLPSVHHQKNSKIINQVKNWDMSMSGVLKRHAVGTYSVLTYTYLSMCFIMRNH